MDVLTLKGLQYEARHGYHEKERLEGNRFEVDLVFVADLRSAGGSDDLDDTIDYQQAEQIVGRVMRGPSKKLIESLAREIGDALFDRFEDAREIRVSVRKLDPPLPATTEYSEVTLTWNR